MRGLVVASATLVTLLTCCSTVLPAGMVVTETHYSDAQELAQVCKGAAACVFVTDTVCDMHLPVAANGDPLYREHELAHCAGSIDPPSPRR